jgi:uncharacterized cupredoxin-like copper-binding protein
MRLAQKMFFIAALAFPAVVLAHGGGQHVMGTVKTVDENGMTVETKESGEVKVVFDAKTTFEKDGAASTVKELSAGARVVVHAAKSEGAAAPVAVFVKFSGAAAQADAAPAAHPTVELSLTDEGFTPEHTELKKGEPVSLVITRKTEKACAKTINLRGYGLKRKLPLNAAVTIKFTPKKSGDIKFTCGKGKTGGVLSVE